MRIMHIVSAAVALSLVACGNTVIGGGGTTPQPPPGCTRDPSGIPFDPSTSQAPLADYFAPAPPPPRGSAPPCAGTWVTSQRLDLTAWGTAFPGGVDKRVAVCVATGKWVGQFSPGVSDLVHGGCTHGPPSANVTVRFGLDYAGDFDRDPSTDPSAPEACIFRSGMMMRSFTVTGIAAIDSAIQSHVTGDIQAQIDHDADDQINQRLPMPGVTSGKPLAAGHSGRCQDWKQASLPLP